MGLIAIPCLIIGAVFGIIAAAVIIYGIAIAIITLVKSTKAHERMLAVLCGLGVTAVGGIIMLIGLFFYTIFDACLQTGF